jgi:ribosomal protein S18 acetylase RimI-like enzyme
MSELSSMQSISLAINEESITTLSQQAEVPIKFEYDRILELELLDNGLNGFKFSEKILEHKRTKDYDAIGGDHPSTWEQRFDVSKWGFIVARSEDKRIGGAVVAFDCPNMNMLDERKDLAVLWDLRVSPEFRSAKVGKLLFSAVEKWASSRGCVQLKIETQNNNVAACRFYAKQGCTLAAVNRFAYKNLPDEIQMIWIKNLQAL